MLSANRQMMSTAMIYFVPVLTLLSYSLAMQDTIPVPAPTVDSVCLREVLINTPQPYDAAQVAAAQRKADSAREAIRQGAAFEDIAQKYSDGPSASLGGALGLFKHGQLAKSIEDKVFAMKVGDVTDVIRTRQGFAILKVVDCGPTTGVGGTSRTVEVLSDTRGVDFGPYIRVIRKRIEANWYRQVPQPAETRTGDVTIEFVIARDGKPGNLHLVASSGDKVLDTAAQEGVTQSAPFPPLPNQYTGSYLALRLHFFYNPDKSTLN